MFMPRVLVVDDDPLNLDIIREFLAPLHLDLHFAASGEMAWNMVSQPSSAYDLVILDRMMPGMSGLDVLALIKAEPRMARLPVILQTAAAAPEQVREGLKAGAYYYLTKPFQPEALLAIVRAALQDACDRVELEQSARRQTETLCLLDSAHFSCRTIDEAQRLAAFLSQLCPNPDAAVIGLTELIVNGIEHGNLGLTYQEKAQLRRNDGWEAEIARRQARPENRRKCVAVNVERCAEAVHFTVIDQGNGFDWEKYLDFDPQRAFDPNGRGIALARQLSFSSLEYRAPGNAVVATINVPAHMQVDEEEDIGFITAVF